MQGEHGLCRIDSGAFQVTACVLVLILEALFHMCPTDKPAIFAIDRGVRTKEGFN